jgi:hypothetical protein
LPFHAGPTETACKLLGGGPGFIPDQASPGEDIGTLLQAANGPANHFLRMTQPGHRGRIDPVDARAKPA